MKGLTADAVSVFDDLEALVLGMSPEQLRRFAAGLDPDDLALLEQVVARVSDSGWRADPAGLAERLTGGAVKRWRYVALLSQAFVRAVEGESIRQVWMLPARYGKTNIASRWGPVWALDRYPSLRVILTSYGADLAAENSGTVRDLIEAHQSRLSVKVRRDRSARDEWYTTEGGMVKAAGVGGAMTGYGGDVIVCFTGDTLIATPNGPQRIDTLATNGGNVWSYEHSTGRVVSAPITAGRINHAADLIEIECASGRRFTCTPEHLIWTEEGWTEARLVTVGTEVSVLGGFGLPGMRDIVQEAGLRGGEIEPGGRDSDMFGRMQREAPASGPPVQNMRESGAEGETCLRFLSDGAPVGAESGCHGGMPALRETVRQELQQATVLLEDVCEQGPCGADEGRGEQPLQGGRLVHVAVSGRQTDRYGTGRSRMRGMQGEAAWETSAGSSHQREQAGQPDREPRGSVRHMSCDPPQVGHDTVSVVRDLRGRGDVVYDLTINGPSNFFAAGVLVHNCDDPFKNWQEAHSAARREHVWNWYRSVVRLRLNTEDSALIVVGTRWHQDDLVGRLLDPPDGEEPEPWEVIRLPAIAEEPDPLSPNEWEHLPDPLGREPGEVLEPERFSEAAVKARARVLGSYLTAAMEQQRPSSAEGGILKRAWWNYYDARPSALADYLVSWDASFKDADGSSFCVGQVWARSGSLYYLVDQVRDRMDYPTFKRAVESLSAKWPEARVVLIEDKANGPAVIADLRGKLGGIIPVSPEGSKESRAHAVSGVIEAGDVFLPDPSVSDERVDRSFVSGFVEECADFPNASNDDQVDAMTQALNRYMNAPPPVKTPAPGGARQGAQWRP